MYQSPDVPLWQWVSDTGTVHRERSVWLWRLIYYGRVLYGTSTWTSDLCEGSVSLRGPASVHSLGTARGGKLRRLSLAHFFWKAASLPTPFREDPLWPEGRRKARDHWHKSARLWSRSTTALISQHLTSRRRGASSEHAGASGCQLVSTCWLRFPGLWGCTHGYTMVGCTQL